MQWSVSISNIYKNILLYKNNSRVAQWKRAGPITQRSVDRNYALLVDFFHLVHLDWICQSGALHCCLLAALVPLAQRIARWTSNPKVLGSIPRWDEQSLVAWCSGYHVCFTRRRSPVRSWARSVLFGFRRENIRWKKFGVKLNMSGWPSGLRRQTQGLPCSAIQSCHENSGPLMRAWVRIPHLTKLFAAPASVQPTFLEGAFPPVMGV